AGLRLAVPLPESTDLLVLLVVDHRAAGLVAAVDDDQERLRSTSSLGVQKTEEPVVATLEVLPSLVPPPHVSVHRLPHPTASELVGRRGGYGNEDRREVVLHRVGAGVEEVLCGHALVVVHVKDDVVGVLAGGRFCLRLALLAALAHRGDGTGSGPQPRAGSAASAQSQTQPSRPFGSRKRTWTGSPGPCKSLAGDAGLSGLPLVEPRKFGKGFFGPHDR